jgi:hypothetical protein
VLWREIQITLAVAAFSALAQPCLGAQPSSVPADGHNGSVHHLDGSGRQIASIIPGVGNLNPALGIRAAATAVRQRAHKAGAGRYIKVPASLDEAADFCAVTANQLSKLAAENAVKVGTWFTALARQIASNPTITPSGMPYEAVAIPRGEIQPVTCDNRNWYMPDGRLKRLVQR